MPELAEVEYYRRCWDAGLRQRVLRVVLHGGKRVFRGSDPALIERALGGAKMLGSETHGKQMLFRFSGGAWLGLHLGMSGSLRVEPRDFSPGRHDHLVLFQKARALVFSDPRTFGRIRFHRRKSAPDWWTSLPPAVGSREFTVKSLRVVFEQRRKAPIKAVLLDQTLFPGIGNWMADEILWQARLDPRRPAAGLDAAELRALWKTSRQVARTALATIGVNWSDPPRGWLIHQRGRKSGRCPRDGTPLKHATIGGRTTAWCPRCQSAASVSAKKSRAPASRRHSSVR
jgi:formamidopyrimidine-DNA glycosylase